MFRIGIIGTGNIGTDLLIKSLRSPNLEPVIFMGRNFNSPGMLRARSLGVPVSDKGIQYIEENPVSVDLVFDATSARDHIRHADILKKLGKLVMDLTPAKIGKLCIPAVNLKECLNEQNLNMVTCGGQASIPIGYAIGLTHPKVEYIEVVSSIASRSAGPATRVNLDEYIETTEKGLKLFSGAKSSKAILNLNPAEPCINMQTTIFAKVETPNLNALKTEIQQILPKIQKYVPGYELILGPIFENGRIVVMVRVKGLGDYLPEYAGNLDIINCAAIQMAEDFAKGMK